MNALSRELRKERHSVSALFFHLVFVTKYRRCCFTLESLKAIEASMLSASKKLGVNLLEFNGGQDHVHLMVEIPPKLSVSRIVNTLKGVSSRAYGKLGFHKPKAETLWSPSYFACSCGGAPLEIVQQYIQQQKKPS